MLRELVFWDIGMCICILLICSVVVVRFGFFVFISSVICLCDIVVMVFGSLYVLLCGVIVNS